MNRSLPGPDEFDNNQPGRHLHFYPILRTLVYLYPCLADLPDHWQSLLETQLRHRAELREASDTKVILYLPYDNLFFEFEKINGVWQWLIRNLTPKPYPNIYPRLPPLY